ncbi:MAG: ribonuclease Y [Calditrichota bacterium]
MLTWVVALLIGIVAGGAIVFIYLKTTSSQTIGNAKVEAERLLADAQKEGEALKKERLIEAQEEIYEQKQKLESDLEDQQIELQEVQKNLDLREVDLEQKGERIERKEKELLRLEDQLRSEKADVDLKEVELREAINAQHLKLEEISGFSKDEAKRVLLADLEEEAHEEGRRLSSQIIEQSKLEAERKARQILVQAIQQIASRQSVEATVSIVELPSDDMKGRIIGREGRNIRSFELATGVDVIIDDTPDIVVLSSYNSYRREIAKRSLDKLISDGRIHPSRIEEIVEKTTEEMRDSLRELGDQALLDAGIHGVSGELAGLLGKLRYRTSFGQNVLDHSIETASLCGIMAAELGLDVKLAKRAALFHDIGKAVDNFTEANHAQLGAELLRKHNEHKVVVNAAESHHDAVEPNSSISALVQIANLVSGTRPGARRESLDTFIKRMSELENICKKFEGVEESFAIQAGREVRAIVETEKVDDNRARSLARDIAKEIQMNIEFPGQIKVSVIREYRAHDIAT